MPPGHTRCALTKKLCAILEVHHNERFFYLVPEKPFKTGRIYYLNPCGQRDGTEWRTLPYFVIPQRDSDIEVCLEKNLFDSGQAHSIDYQSMGVTYIFL